MPDDEMDCADFRRAMEIIPLRMEIPGTGAAAKTFSSSQAAHDYQQQEGEGDDQQCLDRDQHATIRAGRAR
jgi:hypothetical protein